MVDKVTIATEEAPPPIGPSSHAVKSGNILFVSGQIAMDPKTRRLVDQDAAEEALCGLPFRFLTPWDARHAVFSILTAFGYPSGISHLLQPGRRVDSNGD